MALSDVAILKFIESGEMGIHPFEESRLSPAGYDLGAAKNTVLKPKEQQLVATLERVEIPSTLLGILHLRSSFAREGLVASLAVVDPGFRGQLTVSLVNVGKKSVKIAHGESFLQLTFIQLSSESKRPYDGHYQNSSGIVESKREVTSSLVQEGRD